MKNLGGVFLKTSVPEDNTGTPNHALGEPAMVDDYVRATKGGLLEEGDM